MPSFSIKKLHKEVCKTGKIYTHYPVNQGFTYRKYTALVVRTLFIIKRK